MSDEIQPMTRAAFMQLAAIYAMQGMLANSKYLVLGRYNLASEAVRYAEALTEAMSEPEASDEPKTSSRRQAEAKPELKICTERSPMDNSRCYWKAGHHGQHVSRNNGWYTRPAAATEKAAEPAEVFPRTAHEWLGDALSRYQVSHVHDAIRAALKAMDPTEAAPPVADEGAAEETFAEWWKWHRLGTDRVLAEAAWNAAKGIR